MNPDTQDHIARITALEIVVQQISRNVHRLDEANVSPPTLHSEGSIGQALAEKYGPDFIDECNKHIENLWWT